MRIGLLTDLEGQRVWHGWLSEDLARFGDQLVILRPSGTPTAAYPVGLQLALWLDPAIFKVKGVHAFDALSGIRIAEHDSIDVNATQPFDVLIDACSAAGKRPPARRVLRLLFNGQSSELAAVAAILGDQPVTVSLDNGQGEISENAWPGFALRDCLTTSLDNLFSAVVELLTDRACSRSARPVAAPTPTSSHRIFQMSGDPKQFLATQGGLRYLAKSINLQVWNYLSRHIRTPKKWAIATRLCSGDGLVHGGWPNTAMFDIIPDDGSRYYADPFLLEHGGKLHLFAEELPFATRRGLISVAEVGTDGRVGSFRPVLESNTHLSYPFVFEHDGQVWMIPEASGGGAVELYRAVDYPTKWTHDRTLLDGVPGCDATIIRDGGRYVMILTTVRWRGTTWDNQRIFYARTPLGPWTERPGGLVCIDNAVSRPAGPPLLRKGRQLRPVQNCSAHYGGGITLLDVRYPEGDELIETPVATLAPVGLSNISSAHTYARSASAEAVDVWGNLNGVRRVEIRCAPVQNERQMAEEIVTS